MTGTRLPDQNNEQRLYLVARVLPTPHLGGVTADFDWDRVDLGAAGGDLAELPRRYGEGHWRTGSLTRSAGSTIVTCPVSTTCLGRSEGWEALMIC